MHWTHKTRILSASLGAKGLGGQINSLRFPVRRTPASPALPKVPSPGRRNIKPTPNRKHIVNEEVAGGRSAARSCTSNGRSPATETLRMLRLLPIRLAFASPPHGPVNDGWRCSTRHPGKRPSRGASRGNWSTAGRCELMCALHGHGTRKENVVFQVDVLMQIGFKAL